MPRERLTFRQRDITAAIRAVERAGHAVARIEINRDGTIVILPAAGSNELYEDQPEPNPWDELYADDPAGSAYAAALEATAARTPKPRRSTQMIPAPAGPKKVISFDPRRRRR